MFCSLSFSVDGELDSNYSQRTEPPVAVTSATRVVFIPAEYWRGRDSARALKLF